uniref:Cullin family profile domain-containing protein n=1 Tax=viral metagenome TaxID=1070528 RepID=A0A6C0JSB2_9ZZZZ
MNTEISKYLEILEKVDSGEVSTAKGFVISNVLVPIAKKDDVEQLIEKKIAENPNIKPSTKKYIKTVPAGYVQLGVETSMFHLGEVKTKEIIAGIVKDIRDATKDVPSDNKTEKKASEKNKMIKTLTDREASQDTHIVNFYRQAFEYNFNLTKGPKCNEIYDSYTIYFKNRVSSFEYTNLDEYVKWVNQLKQRATSFMKITAFYHYEQYKKYGKTTKDYLIEILANHFNTLATRIFNQLNILIIKDQQERQINRSTIHQMLLILAEYNNTDFKDVYISGCCWYDDWVVEKLAVFETGGLSAFALVTDATKMIKYVEESVDSYNCYVVETGLLLTEKIAKPIMVRMLPLVDTFLDNDQTDVMTALFTLGSRVDIRSIGEKIVNNIVSRSTPVITTDIKTTTDSFFIPTLLEKNKKYCRVLKAYPDTWKLVGFVKIIESIDRFTETFAIYIDSLFRKKQNEEEFEATFKEIVSFVTYIPEKDVFQRYYTNHFAKRMLSATTSVELERTALTLIKARFGMSFVHNMEMMYKDIEAAKEFNVAFSEVKTFKLNLSVSALAAGFWPKASTISVPLVLAPYVDEFTVFYKKRFSGRRLTMLSFGTAEVLFDKKYNLQVNTSQMCILVVMNNEGETTVANLMLTTGLSKSDVERHLMSLTSAKHPVLVKKVSNDVNVYSINMVFKSKTRNVKVGTMAAQKETVEEKKETDSKINQSREFQVRAAVVRTMKARKTLNYNGIVIEVVNALKTYFTPEPVFIKKQIEFLIEQEYMERSQENPAMFNYVA